MQSIDHAECRGLNARISAGGGRITVTHNFPPEKTEIPLSAILAIELVANSIFPPIILSVVSAVFLAGIWWFVGEWSWPIALPAAYLSVSSWAALSCAIGLVGTVYASLFGKINIETLDSERVTIHVIPKRSGQMLVNRIRQTIREAGQ